MWNPFRKSLGKRMLARRSKLQFRSINDLQSEDLLLKWSARAKPFVNFTDKNHFKLVGRAREICLNNSYGKAAMRIMKHNVVGEHGMRMQSHVKLPNGELDMDTNNAIEAAWAEFSQAYNLDTAGQMNLQEMQETALSALVTDGEFFFHVMDNKDYPHGLKVQEIDALRIPPQSSSRYRLAEKHEVYKNGIIFDKATGAPKFYSLNEDMLASYSVDVNVGKKVDASKMLHGYIKEQTGQVRGLPLGQTSAATLYMIGKYVEAALQNARIGATKIGFLTQESNEPPAIRPKLDEEGNPLVDEDGNVVYEDALDGAEIKLEPGTLNQLPPGYDFSDWSPEYPNQEFEGFMRVMLREAATGFQVPYADLSGDLTSVNYSSIRQGALETRENYKILQKVLINKFLSPLFKKWLPFALMKGIIVVNGKPLSVADVNKLCKPVWTPKRWPWIDPQSEARANSIAVKSGLKAPSQIIKEMGGDPEEVWETYKQDIDTMKAKGIPDTIISGIFAEKAPTVEEILAELGEIIGIGGTPNAT